MPDLQSELQRWLMSTRPRTSKEEQAEGKKHDEPTGRNTFFSEKVRDHITAASRARATK